MRIFAFLTLLGILLAPSHMAAQQREPQNIFRIRVGLGYAIEHGQRTDRFYVLHQLFSDSLGRNHTEIDYDWATQYPHRHRWHHYEGMRKHTTEHFYRGQLVRREVFEHDADQRLRALAIWSITPTDTLLAQRVVYTYNPDGTLALAEGFDAQGRRGYRATHRFDAQGTEVSRRVRGRRLVPPDSIVRLTRVPQYNGQGQITSETLTVQRFGGEPTTTVHEYTYAAHGDVATHVIRSASGAVQERRVYSYRHDNRILRLERFDGNDTLIEHKVWRYEIYRWPVRRHRILE